MQTFPGSNTATGSWRHLAAGAALLGVMLAACSGEAGDAGSGGADEPAHSFPVLGTRKGEYFYPEFQRWRIVQVKRVPGAKIPADAGGIGTILLGRSMYLGRSYITIPFLNADGEVIAPACFRQTDASLEAQLVTGNRSESGEAMMLRLGGAGRLSVVLFEMFELTLEREEFLLGDEPGQDAFDRIYNRSIERERVRVEAAPCELVAATLKPLVNGPVELVAPEQGTRLVVSDADLDLRTPIDSFGMSQEWRRELDPALPANNVGGCAGEVFVTRLTSGSAERMSDQTEYRLLGSMFGTDSRGTLCGRTRFLRRIDPERLLDIVALPPAGNSGGRLREPEMRLLRWIDDGVFRATVGEAEFELTVFDEPKIHVRLISAPPPQAAAAAAKRAEVQSAPRRLPSVQAIEAQVELVSDAEPGDEIHRWVDEHGVVHYSDLPAPQ